MDRLVVSKWEPNLNSIFIFIKEGQEHTWNGKIFEKIKGCKEEWPY